MVMNEQIQQSVKYQNLPLITGTLGEMTIGMLSYMIANGLQGICAYWASELMKLLSIECSSNP